MRIETDRKFLVKPLAFLYFNAKPGCNHGGNLWMGHCDRCLGCLGNKEFIGERAVFETDQLTESNLAGVYHGKLFVDAKLFTVLQAIPSEHESKNGQTHD